MQLKVAEPECSTMSTELQALELGHFGEDAEHEDESCEVHQSFHARHPEGKRGVENLGKLWSANSRHWISRAVHLFPLCVAFLSPAWGSSPAAMHCLPSICGPSRTWRMAPSSTHKLCGYLIAERSSFPLVVWTRKPTGQTRR